MTALPATSSDYYSRACECAMTVEVTKLYRLIDTCDVRARCADEYVCVCVCVRARARWTKVLPVDKAAECA